MTENATVYTRRLNQAEIKAVIQGLPELLQQIDADCVLSIEYGCGCNIHDDLQYKPMAVGIAWLDKFIADSTEQCIYESGKSDLSLATPNGGVTILLCHEGDIHIEGNDLAQIELVTKSDLLREYLKQDCEPAPPAGRGEAPRP